MADYSEALRRSAAKGPKRKKRTGAPQTLWSSPTSAATRELAAKAAIDEKVEEIQQSPKHKAPSKQAPSKQAPSKQAPSKQAPSNKAPIKQASSNKAPIKQASIDEAPSKRASNAKAPSKHMSIVPTTAHKKIVQQESNREAPSEDKPFNSAPIRNVQRPQGSEASSRTSSATIAAADRRPGASVSKDRALPLYVRTTESGHQHTVDSSDGTNKTEAIETTSALTATTAPTKSAMDDFDLADYSQQIQQSPSYQAPSGQAPNTSTPSDQAPYASAPSDQAPYASAPSDQAPYASTPSDQAPYASTPSDQAPSASTPSSQAPYASTPSSQAPYASTPSVQAPSPSTPSARAPGASTPSIQTLSHQAPFLQATDYEQPTSRDPLPKEPIAWWPNQEPLVKSKQVHSSHLYEAAPEPATLHADLSYEPSTARSTDGSYPIEAPLTKQPSHINSRVMTTEPSPDTIDATPTENQSSQPITESPTKLRLRPVTVGKAKQLPPPPIGIDLSKDDRFLRRYWIDSEPSKLPRSQERFLFFYCFLYRLASETNCSRVLCTNDMASEYFGKKAKATLTNYRQVGERYGLFNTHLLTNFEKKPGEDAGTYFFLKSPWTEE